MIHQAREILMRSVFGDGFRGAIANKGLDWLFEESSKALRSEPELLDQVRLKPGESFTVIARPPATRRERKLASRVEKLRDRADELGRTSRNQRKAARRLAKAQRRLDRRRTGTKRYEKARKKEARAAARFDAAMRPSEKLVKVRRELDAAGSELDSLRSESLRAARAGRDLEENTTVFR